jgi:hypothetical protein
LGEVHRCNDGGIERRESQREVDDPHDFSPVRKQPESSRGAATAGSRNSAVIVSPHCVGTVSKLIEPLGGCRQTLDFLRNHFGKSGDWYYELVRGQDYRPVQARPGAEVLRIRDDLRRGPYRSRPDRSRRHCDGRRGLDLVRESQFSRSDCHSENQVGRLSNLHP